MKHAARAILIALAVLSGAAAATALCGCRSRQSVAESVALPTVPQPMNAYAIPAWNVGGQIVTGCGAGGKACQ